jgi:Ca2+-binding EF-hand superfamily protein
MKMLLLSAAAAGSLALVVPALAQTAPGADGPVVVEIHKGPMTRAGVVEMVQSHFARLDSNHDGFLTRDELNSAHDRIRSKMHTRFEKRIAERGHYMPDRGAMFDRLDTNRDGYISRQEFTSAKPMVEKRVVVMNGGEGMEEHGMKDVRIHRMGMRFGGHMFEKADSNNDGKVSIQEATNAAAAHFDSADANHDGTLSPEEMRAAHEAMRAGTKS